jgi:hypothetical protein
VFRGKPYAIAVEGVTVGASEDEVVDIDEEFAPSGSPTTGDCPASLPIGALNRPRDS